MSESPVRVLAVEDNEGDFKILQILFSKIKHRRYQLENSSSLPDALEKLGRAEHQVYLVDYRLGPDSGLEFLKKAATLKCSSPIILLTAYDDPELDLEAMKLGAADYLNKNKLDADLLERSMRYASQNKRTLEALAREEEFFRVLTENAMDGVGLVEAGGKVHYLNQALERILGYNPGELIEKNWEDLIHPEDMPRVRDLYAYLLEVAGNSQAIEGRVRHKDGSWRVIEATAKSHFFFNSSFVGVVFNYRDVTNSKRAERNNSRLATIVESSEDAIYAVSLDGTVLSWNPGAQKIYGYAPEEIMGLDIFRLAPPDQRDEFPRLLDVVRDGKAVNNFMATHLTKSGKEVFLSLTLSPIKNSMGQVSSVSLIARDVTERKKAEEFQRQNEERLRLAQKMDAIGRLAGGVAHDFNNLLSVVGGNAEFLLSELSAEDKHREEVGEIQKAVRRGAELTKQLLVFGQKQVSQPQPVNLNDLCGEMSKMLRRLIDATIDLKIIRDKNLQAILADPGQLQQVILNLVLNARDAMPQGGHLIVETRYIGAENLEQEERPTLPREAFVRLSVTDTGTGMDEETQKRVFEPFFTTKAEKGTGLGLATVYGIVKKWNGQIFFHSSLGMGTTFVLYFQALSGVIKASSQTRQVSLIPQGSETLLVAEDEAPVRKILVRALQKYGYQVLEAGDGVEAVQKVRNYPGTIHLLLTDTVMPKMNGKELADELRKTRPKIKVAFISGYPREILSQQGILDPGIHLIQKPFELEDLAGRLRRILDEK